MRGLNLIMGMLGWCKYNKIAGGGSLIFHPLENCFPYYSLPPLPWSPSHPFCTLRVQSCKVLRACNSYCSHWELRVFSTLQDQISDAKLLPFTLLYHLHLMCNLQLFVSLLSLANRFPWVVLPYIQGCVLAEYGSEHQKRFNTSYCATDLVNCQSWVTRL